MQVKNENRTRLSLPLWAWVLATLAFAAGPIFFYFMARGDGPTAWLRVLMGIAGGTILAGYFLLLGYVNRDARRRGMNPLLWTLIALLIPNCLGVLLYFILRQPLQRICPQCGNTVQMGSNFCPRCSYKLSASCPQCQRAVGASDAYCPNCGTSLLNQTTPDFAARS